MKFDIVRAWKDETYRQSLDDEQLCVLPANPAGELSDDQLEQVCGGGGGLPSSSPVAPSMAHVHHAFRRTAIVGVTSSAASVTHIHSYSLICDINVFSLSVLNDIVSAHGLISILSPETQCCANSD